jgi:tight adherence protein C
MNEIDAYLPLGLTADGLLVLLLGAVAFFSVVAVWYGLLESDPTSHRLRMMQARRDELRSNLQTRSPRRKRMESLDYMSRVVNALKLAQASQSRKLHDKLSHAGLRSRDALIVFLFFKLTMPIAAGILGFMLIFPGGFADLPPTMRPLALLAATGLGFFLPDIYVKNAATRRSQALQKGLPDALDLMVICAEAGLSLDATLERVAQELGGSNAELADELALTSVELGFLPERRTALVNLMRRTDLQSIRGVVNTLLQTEKYGTPLAQSLRVLSREFRDQRMLRAEEKAARLPATLTVPMIVFILPTLFIVLAGPAMLDVYDQLIRGGPAG